MIMPLDEFHGTLQMMTQHWNGNKPLAVNMLTQIYVNVSDAPNYYDNKHFDICNKLLYQNKKKSHQGSICFQQACHKVVTHL